jgi:hypothetical protein
MEQGSDPRVGNKGKLLNESEWSRTYELPGHQVYRESKFLKEGLNASSIDVLRRWPTWSEGERLEFANAFWCKPKLTSDDHEIIRFLMKEPSLDVRRAVAIRSCELPSPEEAVDLLVSSIQQSADDYANFLQPLAILRHPRALPLLVALHDQLEATVESGAGKNPYRIIDYLWCSKALYALTREPRFSELITRFLTHPDKPVRSCAEQLLKMA